MRKFLALILAVLLVTALTFTAFANETPHTITITNRDAAEAHSYTAYQVFEGVYDETTGTLSDAKWGSGVSYPMIADHLIAGIPAFADCVTVPQFITALSNIPANSDELRAFAAIVDECKAEPAGSATGDAENPAVIHVNGDGYYFVKDDTPTLNTDTYSDYILFVEGNVTVEAKDTTGVTSEKKVKDINDSTAEGSDWQDSADYDIGDPVPFRISGTVAADFDKYESYKLIFHDRESDGLTFDHITGVFVDGQEIETGWELIAAPEDGCTFEVVFRDLKTVETVHGGSEIAVEYISVLNENAVIGVPGNPNEMRMEYSNNPTDETATGLTPWDEVVVFTYEVIIDKVDENGEKLPGAAFSLEKWVIDEEYPEGHWVLIPGEITEADEGGLGRILRVNDLPARHYTAPDGERYVIVRDKPNEQAAVIDLYLRVSDLDAIDALIENRPSIGIEYYFFRDGVLVKNDTNFTYAVRSITRAPNDGATFVWQGVDDGHYRITETVTPPGYNTIEPFEFDIYAEHETVSETPALISVTGDPFGPTAENIGILHTEIENHSGAQLPETGGIGTVIFYAVGGLLVLVAGLILFVRRRSEN